MIKIFIKQKSRGYTIIEMMIAIALFLVVVMLGMGALLNANLIHQKNADFRSAIDNLSFIMEDMSRNLRTGSNYHCLVGQDDLSLASISTPKSGTNCWGVAFESSNGLKSNQNDQWVYYIGNHNILKFTQGPYNDASNAVQLTPSEVSIQYASSFSVLGAETPPGNLQQPFVNIMLVGTITSKGVVTPFSLQTSISQRLLDV